jgi:hypothetical protein
MMEKGPMKFHENLIFEIAYDLESRMGSISDGISGKHPFKVTELDSVISIEITYRSNVIKKGVIVRCDNEMLKMKFENTIEEFTRKL